MICEYLAFAKLYRRYLGVTPAALCSRASRSLEATLTMHTSLTCTVSVHVAGQENALAKKGFDQKHATVGP